MRSLEQNLIKTNIQRNILVLVGTYSNYSVMNFCPVTDLISLIFNTYLNKLSIDKVI